MHLYYAIYFMCNIFFNNALLINRNLPPILLWKYKESRLFLCFNIYQRKVQTYVCKI